MTSHSKLIVGIEIMFLFLVLDVITVAVILFYARFLVRRSQKADQANKALYKRAILATINNINTNVYRCVVVVDKMDKSSSYTDLYKTELGGEIQKMPESQKDLLSSMEETDRAIMKSMVNLKEAPVIYRKVYEQLYEYHTAYSRMYGLIAGSQGNLMIFSDRINQLVRDCLRLFSSLQINIARISAAG